MMFIPAITGNRPDDGQVDGQVDVDLEYCKEIIWSGYVAPAYCDDLIFN